MTAIVGTKHFDPRQISRRLAAEHATARVLAEAARLADAAPRILAAICETLGRLARRPRTR